MSEEKLHIEPGDLASLGLARAFLARLPPTVHTAVLDAVVLFGGAAMLYGALVVFG
jgi:hypothetical protein